MYVAIIFSPVEAEKGMESKWEFLPLSKGRGVDI